MFSALHVLSIITHTLWSGEQEGLVIISKSQSWQIIEKYIWPGFMPIKSTFRRPSGLISCIIKHISIAPGFEPDPNSSGSRDLELFLSPFCTTVSSYKCGKQTKKKKKISKFYFCSKVLWFQGKKFFWGGPGHMARGILVLWSGIEPAPPAVEEGSLLTIGQPRKAPWISIQGFAMQKKKKKKAGGRGGKTKK